MSLFTRSLLRYRIMVLILLGAVTCIFAFGIGGYELVFSIKSVLRSKDPALVRELDHYQRFASPDKLCLFGFDCIDPGSEPALARLRDVEAAIRRIPGVTRSWSVLSTPAVAMLAGDGLINKLEKSRFFRRLFVSKPSGTRPGALSGLIQFTDMKELSSSQRFEKRARVLHALNRLEEQYHSLIDPGKPMVLKLSGFPVLRHNYIKLIEADLRFYLPTGAISTLVLLLFLVPGIGLAIASILIVPLTLVWTFGFLGFQGAKISLLASTLPTLLMVISVADAVHMTLRYRQERDLGYSPKEAAERALMHTAFPCFLTSLTTAIGFGTFLLASVSDLRDFGYYASLGIGFAFLLTMLFLPASLPFLGSIGEEGAAKRSKLRGSLLLASFSKKLGMLPPRAVMFVFSLVILLALYCTSRVRVDSFVIEDFWPDSKIAKDFLWFEDRFTGSITGEILVGAKTGSLWTQEAQKELREFTDWVEGHEGVLRSMSFLDAVEDGLPESFLPMLAQPPFGLLDSELESARVLVFMRDMGSTGIDRYITAVKEKATSLQHLNVRPAGVQVLAIRQVTGIVEEVLTSFFFAFLLIAAIMTLFFRSLRYGLIAMIPNVFPLLISTGFMGFFAINLRVTVVISFAISFGLAVDNTIHILSRYRSERALGESVEHAVANAMEAVGSAVWTTSLLLLLGFSIVIFSHFKASHDFGLLVCVTIAAALAGDLLLLPALLRTFGGRKSEGSH